MKKEKAQVSRTKIEFLSKTNRRIVAIEDMKEEDTIIWIPQNLYLTENIYKDTPIGAQLYQVNKWDESKYGCRKLLSLSIFLMWERRKPQTESTFGPYLALLDWKMNHLPLFFNGREDYELMGSY